MKLHHAVLICIYAPEMESGLSPKPLEKGDAFAD
jgi:hypothetical protein